MRGGPPWFSSDSPHPQVGPANGLERRSVVNCDHITTIPCDALGREIGALRINDEPALTAAMRSAFDLD